MDAALPFRPQGTGVLLGVTNNAPAAASQPQGPNAGDVCYLVFNPSATAADAFIGYGPTSAAAISAAIVPTLAAPVPNATGQGAGAFLAPAGTLQVVSLAPGMFFAGRSLGSCSIWIQPGYGV